MRKVILLFVLSVALVSCDPNEKDAYIVGQQFVKTAITGQFFEADFPLMDYRYDDLKFNTFLILSYFEGKNKYGVKSRVNYRIKLKYSGEGDKLDSENWELLNLKFTN